MNTISIIIPAYNAASFLPGAIQSCLNQTLPACEIILVDDGSTDETAAVAKNLFSQSTEAVTAFVAPVLGASRTLSPLSSCAPSASCPSSASATVKNGSASFGNAIQYLRIENGGVSGARNVGAARARGEWLVFLDADDQLLPHALESLLKTALENKAGVAYGMVIERREPPLLPRLNGFDYAAGIPPHGAERNFWRCAIITPGSVIVKASLHKAVGGFVNGYEPMEDRDYWIKCGLLEPVAFCDTVVLDKMWRPASHGSQHSKRIYRGQQALRALKIWACDRGVKKEWMPNDKKILRSALDEAVWRRHYDILPALLEEAKALQLFHWKAKLLSIFFYQKNPEWLILKNHRK